MVEVFNKRSAQYSLLLCLGVGVTFFQLPTLGKAVCEWEGGYGKSRRREPLAVWSSQWSTGAALTGRGQSINGTHSGEQEQGSRW